MLTVIFSVVLPHPFAFFVVATGLEPVGFVFEEFLPHPYYRNNAVIVDVWITRLIIFDICACEYMRFISFLVTMFVLKVSVVVSSILFLLALPEKTSIFLYIQI